MFKEKLLSRYRQISFPTNTKISRINSCYQLLSHVNADELGYLFEVDFSSFWAQVEEEEAHRKSKDSDCEKALIKLEHGTSSVQKGVVGHPRIGPGKKALTFELVSWHFCMPIKQAVQELKVGVKVLKKQCRELGIARWPHRKVKSLNTLIDNIQISAYSLVGAYCHGIQFIGSFY
jgi:hypothetical protein